MDFLSRDIQRIHCTKKATHTSYTLAITDTQKLVVTANIT